MRGQSVVVDDHLLLRIVLDDEPRQLRPQGAQVFTTGLWYHRLCRSIGDRSVIGAFSRAIGSSDPSVAAAAIEAITSLPTSIGLISLRELAWPMARLIDDGIRLNLMSLEALAAAEHLGAELCLAVADANPPLLAAAGGRVTPTRLIDG
ncbi:MAG: hypothetical protein ACR2KC_01090 [Acidimicrobiales bacterium]